MKYETFLQNFFSAWQTRDWDFVDNAVADDFTFTSPYDDHINRCEYKLKCWDAVKEIEAYEFVTIMENDDEAFVRYKGRINGVQVQNTEHFIFRDGKIKEI